MGIGSLPAPACGVPLGTCPQVSLPLIRKDYPPSLRNRLRGIHWLPSFRSSSINPGQFMISVFSDGILLNISTPCLSTNLSSEKSRSTFLFLFRHSKIFSSKIETHSDPILPSSFSLTPEGFSYTLLIRSTDALPSRFGKCWDSFFTSRNTCLS